MSYAIFLKKSPSFCDYMESHLSHTVTIHSVTISKVDCIWIVKKYEAPYEHVVEKEEQHNGRERQPAMYDFVKMKFIQQYKHYSHDDDHANKYGRIRH